MHGSSIRASLRKSLTLAFPVRCAKAAGRRIIVLADPGLVKQTVPTDDTSGGVEMYRDYQGCS